MLCEKLNSLLSIDRLEAESGLARGASGSARRGIRRAALGSARPRPGSSACVNNEWVGLAFMMRPGRIQHSGRPRTVPNQLTGYK